MTDEHDIVRPFPQFFFRLRREDATGKRTECEEIYGDAGADVVDGHGKAAKSPSDDQPVRGDEKDFGAEIQQRENGGTEDRPQVSQSGTPETGTDVKLFSAVQEQMKQRSNSNYRGVKKYDNIYTGRIFCGD